MLETPPPYIHIGRQPTVYTQVNIYIYIYKYIYIYIYKYIQLYGNVEVPPTSEIGLKWLILNILL